MACKRQTRLTSKGTCGKCRKATGDVSNSLGGYTGYFAVARRVRTEDSNYMEAVLTFTNTGTTAELYYVSFNDQRQRL